MSYLLGAEDLINFDRKLHHALPEVAESDRREAFARGLGYKSDTALWTAMSASLVARPTSKSMRFEPDTAAFNAYLNARYDEPVPPRLFEQNLNHAEPVVARSVELPISETSPYQLRVMASVLAGAVEMAGREDSKDDSVTSGDEVAWKYLDTANAVLADLQNHGLTIVPHCD